MTIPLCIMPVMEASDLSCLELSPGGENYPIKQKMTGPPFTAMIRPESMPPAMHRAPKSHEP